MTIYDISEKAGVSIATVSRVLNGSSRVSNETRQKVLRIMEESGYTPNAFARGLGLNTMKIVGIMCADSSDIYLAKAVYFMEQELRSSGYDSLLCCSGYQLENKVSAMNLLLNKKVDAIILVGSNFAYESAEDNKYIIDAAASVPVMLLNAYLDIPNVYCVLSTDFDSTYLATKELIGRGTQRIVYFYNSNSYSSRMKQGGYRKAMQEAGLYRPELERFFEGSHEDIPSMADRLCKDYDELDGFDGMICADDVLALSALRFAKQKGLVVPQDLSVIGYNNSMLAYCGEMDMSSIDNKPEILCKQLIRNLLEVLGGNEEVPNKTVFEGELVHRGTTKQA